MQGGSPFNIFHRSVTERSPLVLLNILIWLVLVIKTKQTDKRMSELRAEPNTRFILRISLILFMLTEPIRILSSKTF